MKSFIAALRSLTLPFGAGTGQRIVLDGITGLISVYDAANKLRAQIGANSGLQLSTGDTNEATVAQLLTAIVNAGPTLQAEVGLVSPRLKVGSGGGLGQSSILLLSDSLAGGVPTQVQVLADQLLVNPVLNAAADLLLNGESLRFHKDSFDVTTAGDAKVTITHNAPFTPTHVIVINNRLDNFAPGVAWWSSITGSYTATTFRAQFRDTAGGAVISSRVVGEFIAFG